MVTNVQRRIAQLRAREWVLRAVPDIEWMSDSAVEGALAESEELCIREGEQYGRSFEGLCRDSDLFFSNLMVVLEDTGEEKFRAMFSEDGLVSFGVYLKRQDMPGFFYEAGQMQRPITLAPCDNFSGKLLVDVPDWGEKEYLFVGHGTYRHLIDRIAALYPDGIEFVGN